jgi:hypothetical protein
MDWQTGIVPKWLDIFNAAHEEVIAQRLGEEEDTDAEKKISTEEF